MKKEQFFFILFAFFLLGPLGYGIKNLIEVNPAVPKSAIGTNEDLESKPFPARSFASMRACQKWGLPTKIGKLSQNTISEASDIAVSWMNPQMLYHINDSDSGTRFYISDLSGSPIQNIFVKGVKSKDMEDIGVGPCPYSSSCLFLGDVGDNHLDREFGKVVVVKEELRFPDTVIPKNIIRYAFPNGKPKNVEGMAVHPQTGDIYLVSKESSNKDKKIKILIAPPAKIYRLARQLWEKSANNETPIELEKVGEINMNEITGSDKLRHQIITSLDIAPHGKSFVVLTYAGAYEFYFDLSYGIGKPTQSMVAGVDFQEVPLEKLEQQEGISYVVDSRNSSLGFVYDSEVDKDDSPIMFIPCEVPR